MEVVLLEHAGRRFAVDAAWVAEIVEAAPATPLPFAPAWVEGLAGIAGQVLVLIDFGLRLGLPATTGAGTVLVLKLAHERLAVRVDRVLCKIDVPAAALTPHAHGEEDDEAGYVSGEFAWEEQLALCIGEAAFSLAELAAVDEPDGCGGLLGTVSVQEARVEGEAGADEVVCLFFRCAGEVYGLRLSDVAEVLAVEALTPVPQAVAEVAGMLLLRGLPLLVLSLNALLGRPDGEPARSLAVVERDGARLALGVGQVLGIERFPLSGIQALPQSEAGLEGFVVSRRHGMSGLIALPTLLDDERMAIYGKLMTRKAEENAMQDLSQSVGTETIARLLTFRAGNERCALPLDWVQRVAEVADEVAVPGASGDLAGVAQIHGEVIPVVDLTHALGCQNAAGVVDSAAYLVVGGEGGTWALKVDRVERVVNLNTRDIEPVRADAGEWIGAVGKLDGQLLSIIRLDPLQQAA